MTTNMEAFQALLEGMRADFLAELPERCDSFDESILALEKSPDDREAFNELYRGVHSLKGSGGTHGLSIITTLCHQLRISSVRPMPRRGSAQPSPPGRWPMSTCCVRSRQPRTTTSRTIQALKPNWRHYAN